MLDSNNIPSPLWGGQGRGLNSEAKKLINFFFLGLTLPDSAFWVNLQPNQGDRITSDELSVTDLGKILLEQDLKLKKDVANYLNPRNPIGKEFWKKLYAQVSLRDPQGRSNLDKLNISTNNRVWIVPEKAVVVEVEDGALIAEAKLKVMLEAEYFEHLRGGGDSSEVDKVKDGQIEQISESLMKEIVIPAITKDVNESAGYAPLRQIYHSLILAQWYKRKVSQLASKPVNQLNENSKNKPANRQTGSPVNQYINSNKTQGLESAAPWSKDAIYQQYLKSYTQGEYKEAVALKLSAKRYPLFAKKRMYFSGGIFVGFNGQSGSSPLTVVGKEEVANLLKQDPQYLNKLASATTFKNGMVLTAEHPENSDNTNQLPWAKNINLVSNNLNLTEGGALVQQAEQEKPKVENNKEASSTSSPLISTYIFIAGIAASVGYLIHRLLKRSAGNQSNPTLSRNEAVYVPPSKAPASKREGITIKQKALGGFVEGISGGEYISQETRNILKERFGIVPLELARYLNQRLSESEQVGKVFKILGSGLTISDWMRRDTQNSGYLEFERITQQLNISSGFDMPGLEIHFNVNEDENDYKLVLSARDADDLVRGYMSGDCTNPSWRYASQTFNKYIPEHLLSPGFLNFKVYRAKPRASFEWIGNTYTAVLRQDKKALLLIDAIQIPWAGIEERSGMELLPLPSPYDGTNPNIPFPVKNLKEAEKISDAIISVISAEYAPKYGFKKTYLGFGSNFIPLAEHFYTTYASNYNNALSPTEEITRGIGSVSGISLPRNINLLSEKEYALKLQELNFTLVGLDKDKLDSFPNQNYARRGFAEISPVNKFDLPNLHASFILRGADYLRVARQEDTMRWNYLKGSDKFNIVKTLELLAKFKFLGHGTIGFLNTEVNHDRKIPSRDADFLGAISLLKIILKGEITDSSVSEFISGRERYFKYDANYYGPFFVILQLGVKKSDLGKFSVRDGWGDRYHSIGSEFHYAYLLPRDIDKKFFVEAIGRVVKEGAMDKDKAVTAIAKLKTTDELLKVLQESSSSAVPQPAISNPGGIDLSNSNIEVVLNDEKFVSGLAPADLKILRGAKALKQGWNSLAILYLHEVMLMLKYDLIQDMNQRPVALQIMQQPKSGNNLDMRALQFFHFLRSHKTFPEFRASAKRYFTRSNLNEFKNI